MTRLLALPMILASLLGASTAAAECIEGDDPAHLVDHAEQAVLEGRFNDYDDLVARAEAALGCGDVASRTLVARLFLVEGARLAFTENAAGAALAFQSAWRLEPELWNPNYGARLRAAYEAAIAQADVDARGTLLVEPVPEPGWRTAVDGTLMPMPAEVPLGFHLVQVLEEDGPAMYAGRALILDPGEQVVVNTGPLAPRAVAKKRPLWPLLAAGGAAVLAGSAAGLSLAQNQDMTQAGGKPVVESAYARQKAFAYTTYGMSGLAVAGLGLYLAW